MKQRGSRLGPALALLAPLLWTCSDPSEPADAVVGDERASGQEAPEARALAWAASGGWEAALSAIERQIVESDRDPRWVALAARAEMELGRYDLAGRRLEAALAKHPGDTFLCTEQGVIEATRNRHAAAVEVLQKVVEQQPELARAQEYLGRSLEYEALIRMGSRGVDFDVLARSIAALEAAVRLEETVPRLTTLGAVLERGQRLEDALLVHRRAVELDSEHAPAWHAIGRIETELGELAEAHRAFGPALRFAQEDAATWYDYGALLEEMGDEAKARMSYGKALEYDPALARAYYRLGLLTSRAGDPETGEALIAEYERYQGLLEALEAWRFAARETPTDAETIFQLGLAHTTVLQWDRARPWLERAVKLNPDDARAHYQLGRVHHRRDRPVESLAALDRAVARNPEHANAHHLRWQVAKEAGAFDKAAASLETLVRLEPENPGLWFTLGQARRELQRLEEAVEAFERCLALDPGSVLALEMMARAELGLARYDDARSHARELLAHAPDHAVAQAILAEAERLGGEE
ncbi:MAG: tetratricopeptide repeat protein [Planctomycetota bacterium]